MKVLEKLYKQIHILCVTNVLSCYKPDRNNNKKLSVHNEISYIWEMLYNHAKVWNNMEVNCFRYTTVVTYARTYMVLVWSV